MTKLSALLHDWPAGTIGVQPWLEKRNIYRQLSNKYAALGWLVKIGSGAYVRSGEKPTWQGGVYALQQGLGLEVHVGGLSALEELGSSHYIPLGKQRRLFVYSHGTNQPRYLPKWFVDLDDTSVSYMPTPLFNSDVGLTYRDFGFFKIKISTVERALFEVLSLTPHRISYEHACLLMEYQNTLRDDLVEKLLQECNSQIVKRLFLYLARKFSLDFLPHINLQNVDLGSGPRQVGQGKVFDKDLNLYVPPIDQNIDPDLEIP